ncbi:hypothetical protein [Paludibacterium denitrificans]|uniref:Uncharacterized protein n=1 Tax=Paludibacterium denitrificans TaxID=2675226 RepID=A0A844GDE0_9NEIS|nr:hypothetical protein [Paludibacterium denitrificans]MTD33248.1 hypothetical protein [Paludibacterium denitrificans]
MSNLNATRELIFAAENSIEAMQQFGSLFTAIRKLLESNGDEMSHQARQLCTLGETRAFDVANTIDCAREAASEIVTQAKP